ncbi:MAG: hypothetical protein AAF986_05900 [Pseudomonadota bacterium]
MPKLHWPTVIKLLVVSLIVGTIMGMVGADPFEFWEGVWHQARHAFVTLYDVGWEGIKKAVYLTFIGAVVVLPIWGVLEALKRRKATLPSAKDENKK